MQPIDQSLAPFNYFSVEQFLDEKIAAEISSWLRGCNLWKLAKKAFYEQYEFCLKREEALIPTEIMAHFSPHALNVLRARCENFFGVKFHPRSAICAHRISEGQGIGIHTDAVMGYETHRVIVTFFDEYHDTCGGHFVLFNSRNENDVHRVFRPNFNRAVGIELGEKSFHAVADVIKGDRYSLVYSWWDENSHPIDDDREKSRTWLVLPAPAVMTAGTTTL